MEIVWFSPSHDPVTRSDVPAEASFSSAPASSWSDHMIDIIPLSSIYPSYHVSSPWETQILLTPGPCLFRTWMSTRNDSLMKKKYFSFIPHIKKAFKKSKKKYFLFSVTEVKGGWQIFWRLPLYLHSIIFLSQLFFCSGTFNDAKYIMISGEDR